MQSGSAYTFEPLVVEAQLTTPVVGEFTAPLDGILLWAALVDEAPPAFEPGRPFDYDPARVPLRIIDPGPTWFYQCSFAIWGEYTEGRAYWNKRLDSIEAEHYTNARSVNIAQGHYKAYHMPVQYRHGLSVCWRCVGDAAAIEALLSRVVGIGKKYAQGWGAIGAWRVSAAPMDIHSESWGIWDDAGTPLRAVPWGYFMRRAPREATDRSVQAWRAFRPPYWATRAVGQCMMSRS